MSKMVLVHVRDALVESDVVATVQEVLDDARVKVVGSVEAACDALGQFDEWAWAVLDLGDDDLSRPDLRSALAENSALPVVLSEKRDDPETRDWVFLDPPFSTDMLRDALRQTAPY